MTSKANPNSSHFALTAVTALFFMWGFITRMDDLLIPKFKADFALTQFQANLVRFGFFGANLGHDADEAPPNFGVGH